jgi:hypothetical protein
MKRVYFLILLMAALGGYKILVMDTDLESKSQQADMSVRNEACLKYRSAIEAELGSGKKIDSIFYSSQTDSCLFEKRNDSGDFFEVSLIDRETGEVLTSYSSQDLNQREDYREYLETVRSYRR